MPSRSGRVRAQGGVLTRMTGCGRGIDVGDEEARHQSFARPGRRVRYSPKTDPVAFSLRTEVGTGAAGVSRTEATEAISPGYTQKTGGKGQNRKLPSIVADMSLESMQYRTDFAVVGGGLAGMTAALELLNGGGRVLLLDRDEEENFGGLAKESFGGMFFADSPVQRKRGIRDRADIAFDDWCSVAEFGPDDALPKKWAEAFVYGSTEHVYHFLRDHGIRFFPVVQWVERGIFKRGNSLPRFHMVWGTGFELSERMKYRLLTHPKAKDNLVVKFGHRVERLETAAGAVVGISGREESSGRPFRVEAEAVVVAAGGLGGDIEQVKKHWPASRGQAPEIILNGAHRYADGTMHKAVTDIGGKVTDLSCTWPYAAGVHNPRPRRPNDGLSLVPPRSALWLNFRGERIGPVPLVTGFDTAWLVDEICKQEKKYSWQVMNHRIFQKEFAISGSEYNAGFRNKSYVQVARALLRGNTALVKDMLANCPDIVMADDLESLVDAMNELAGTDDVDKSRLVDAVRKYDEEIGRGPKYHNDLQLRLIGHLRKYAGDRIRTCAFQKIEDPRHAPYIAIREFILSRKTLGGMQTDLSGRVLDEGGEPIPGLYAVGEAAGFGGGGLHGKGALEGTFLSGCVFTARVAAYHLLGKSLSG